MARVPLPATVRTLSREEARRVYDRIGSWQDSQAFYEDRAVRDLIRHADFPSARSVFEFGCGTGRIALRLLEEELPSDATYRGMDLSPRMVSLARERLKRFAPRAEVVITDGGPPVDEPAGATDRFVSTYVFDLLSEQDVRAVLREAHRILAPAGLLCLTGLGTAVGPASRLVTGIWTRVHALRPSLVGGCRPLDLLPFLPEAQWRLRHHRKLVAFGLPSEVLVAERR